MSIQNCFADFLEESPVDVAQLTTFSEHIPNEWIAKAATLSEKRLFADVVYLGRVDLCCTHFTQQYIGSHIIVNASDTILA